MYRLRPALTLLPILVAVPMAAAQSGPPQAGEVVSEGNSPLRAIKARSLSAIADDVIRFSSAPALGGRATVIEIHHDGERWAWGKVWFLEGHPSLSWERTGTFEFGLPVADYKALTKQIDSALARPLPKPAEGELVVCTDGPGYLTERRVERKSRYLRGFCGDDHPNNAIARWMAHIVSNAIRPHLRGLGLHTSDDTDSSQP